MYTAQKTSIALTVTCHVTNRPSQGFQITEQMPFNKLNKDEYHFNFEKNNQVS